MQFPRPTLILQRIPVSPLIHELFTAKKKLTGKLTGDFAFMSPISRISAHFPQKLGQEQGITGNSAACL
jgi:hypothetical protein